MQRKKQQKDQVQVSAWIPREYKPLLEAMGGPSESLRKYIEKQAGSETKLLKEKAEIRRMREKLDKREKIIEEAIALLRSSRSNGNGE